MLLRDKKKCPDFHRPCLVAAKQSARMRAMIQLQNISLQRGSKFLLESADLTIFPGQKVGLIGANGSGKSTLFQMLLGKVASDTGSVDIPKQWRIAHMAQEVGHTQRSEEHTSELQSRENLVCRLLL